MTNSGSHIGAHVKVNMTAAVQDVLLGMAGQSSRGWVDGGGGEVEEEYNEKAQCSNLNFGHF